MEKNDVVEEVFIKNKDWWNKHNFGTRFSLMIFLFTFVAVVIYSVTNPEKASKIENVVSISGDLALYAFIIVSVGANTLVKLGELYVKAKGK